MTAGTARTAGTSGTSGAKAADSRRSGVVAARIVAAIVALLVAAAYAPFVPWLIARWRAPDGFFSHGPLVPIACAWLLFRQRRALATAAAMGEGGSWRGLALVLPALVLLVAAAWRRFDSPAIASLLLLLPGLVLLLFGGACLRVAAFPLAFLAFAVPWPMELLADVVQSLKLLVVACSSALVNLFGAGVTAAGSFVVLPDGDRLLVDDECSGLKSAIALLALGVFMSGTARGLTRGRRLAMGALALPLALGANILRVALLAVVARAGGVERARAWHDPSTWSVYALVILAYVLLERRLRCAPVAGATTAAAPPALPVAVAAPKLVVALVLLALSALATWRLHRRVEAAPSRAVALVPAAIGGWQGRDLLVTERQLDLLETRDVLLREYARGDAAVVACLAVAGPEHKAAHPPEVCYRGQGWRIDEQTIWDVELAGRKRSLCELVIAKEGDHVLVWSWYRVGDEETESWWREQWLALCAAIGGRDEPAALLRFSAPIAGGDVKAARKTLVLFLETFLPVADAALAPPVPAGQAPAGDR